MKMHLVFVVENGVWDLVGVFHLEEGAARKAVECNNDGKDTKIMTMDEASTAMIVNHVVGWLAAQR